MQAPDDAFLASTFSYFQGRETIEHFTWSLEQTLESAVSFFLNPKGYVRINIDDEGLSTGAYIEFDIDGDFPIALREVRFDKEQLDFVVVDTDLIMCEGSGRYGIELRPEFVRGGLIGGADTVTLNAPSKPNYWSSRDNIGEIYFFIAIGSGETETNFSIYLCAGKAKPKSFWTDGRGCNYVIQAGVNR